MQLEELLAYRQLYNEHKTNGSFIVQLRLMMVREVLESFQGVKEVAGKARTTQKTIYKWLRRYRESGEKGLSDLPRTPKNQPRKTPTDIEDTVLRLKKQNSAWGSRTIRHYLANPVQSLLHLVRRTYGVCHQTVLRILERKGWLDKNRNKKKEKPRFFDWKYPNNLWQMDAKGHFRTQDGKKTHVIDILDDHSRFCLNAAAWNTLSASNFLAVLDGAVQRHDPPKCILTDNGKYFTSKKFEKYLKNHGIRHIFCRPNHPQTQGKIEAFHKILDREVLQQVDLKNLAHVNSRLRSFVNFYNQERPHGAKDGETPASDYYRKHEVAEN